MKSCSVNDVKIYNLSAGKSLPEWLTERRRRSLQRNDAELRKRIELIQDFDMPGLSTKIRQSDDGNYIIATGTYKPRVRCYDAKNLSMKFERCFDSEVVAFRILSTDYSKMAFLQADRYIEFHAQYGRYFRLRVPKFGRDLALHPPSADLLVAGDSSEVYRLNLELGRFQPPLKTSSKGINKIEVNPLHNLIILGTEEGTVEAWDVRAPKSAAILDVAAHAVDGDFELEGIPSITSLALRGSLGLGVGTATGQVLLYDIRASKPLLVKDHFNTLPIKNIAFHDNDDLVLSMDPKIVKVWERETGKPVTSVEGEADLNDLCLVPNTGMFFAANESRKIYTYYIPSMGPAPRWCSFIDSITEELEEGEGGIYDDYQFVTEEELNGLGLTHLIGTPLLRAYMHGHFMDMRLYRRAKATVQPFQFQDFKKKKIREKLEEERGSRIKLKTLPKVNKDLALRLMDRKDEGILQDSRFKSLFENPDYQVDKNADEYRLLNPVMSHLEKRRTKKLEKMFAPVEKEEQPELEGARSSEESDSSSDDDKEWVEEQRKARRKIKAEQDMLEDSQPKFFEFKGQEFKATDFNPSQKRRSRESFADRLKTEADEIKTKGPLGGREMTFSMRPRRHDSKRDTAAKHHQERKKVRRSAGGLKNKKRAWKK